MDSMFHGTSPKMIQRLHGAVSAHRAVMEGIATHVQKEHAARQQIALKKLHDEALLRSARPPGEY